MNIHLAKLYMLVLTLTLTLALAALPCCDDGSGGGSSVGGKEYLLTGSWWVDQVICINDECQGEGYYFDGAGGGYDLSEDETSVYIDCENPITYTYNGHDLRVVEHEAERPFTFELLTDATATITILGTDFTATLQDITAPCID